MSVSNLKSPINNTCLSCNNFSHHLVNLLLLPAVTELALQSLSTVMGRKVHNHWPAGCRQLVSLLEQRDLWTPFPLSALLLLVFWKVCPLLLHQLSLLSHTLSWWLLTASAANTSSLLSRLSHNLNLFPTHIHSQVPPAFFFCNWCIDMEQCSSCSFKVTGAKTTENSSCWSLQGSPFTYVSYIYGCQMMSYSLLCSKVDCSVLDVPSR